MLNTKTYNLKVEYGPKFSNTESGYALLLVLLLVSLFSITVMGLCRKSVKAANDYRAKDQAFKERWAKRSLEYTLYRTIPRYLELKRLKAIEAESYSSQAKETYVSLQGQVKLSGRIFDWQFEIEDSKLPINTVYQHVGVNGIESALRDLGAESELLLKPLDKSSLPVKEFGYFVNDQRKAFLMFTQLTLNEELSKDWSSSRKSLPQIATLWGDGKLSLQLASEEALKVFLNLTLEGKAIDEALETLALDPNATIEEFLTHYPMPSESRWFLRSVFQNGASTASLRLRYLHGERFKNEVVIKEFTGVNPKVWDRRRWVE